MRHISKRKAAPREYKKWCKDQKGKENEDYRCIPKKELAVLKEALLDEQGGLCAYTMKAIDKDSSHIEHIKPESICRRELRGSDLDYDNLVACFPKDGMRASDRYGAQAKDDWWEDNGRQFVSPLLGKCESLFVYNKKGEISAFQNDPDAKVTIDVLKLDHASLTEERRIAISEFINGREGKTPITARAAEVAINEIAKRKANEGFVEFCIAILNALVEHITYLEKVSLRMKYERQQKQ